MRFHLTTDQTVNSINKNSVYKNPQYIDVLKSVRFVPATSDNTNGISWLSGDFHSKKKMIMFPMCLEASAIYMGDRLWKIVWLIGAEVEKVTDDGQQVIKKLTWGFS